MFSNYSLGFLFKQVIFSLSFDLKVITVSGHDSKLAKFTRQQSTIYLHFVEIVGLQFSWTNWQEKIASGGIREPVAA